MTVQYTRIGALAERHGITLRRLRFYEDKGLLKPERQGATRLYTPFECAKLERILFFTRVGFTLAEIAKLLSIDPASPEMADALREREFELMGEIKQCGAALAEIRQHLAAPTNGRS